MDMNLLFVFVVLNIANVIIQTIKSLVTVKSGKVAAAIANAIAYGFYTIVVIYMVCELPLMLKVLVVGSCNLVGVFLVKWGEEKARKDKLWKVEATIPKSEVDKLLLACKDLDLSYNYVDIQKYYLFNFYCPTQKDSAIIKNLLKDFDAKYFVVESKNL